ncbi:MAG: PAS domain S-box protein, partial [Candidatus Binatia bacterium]
MPQLPARLTIHDIPEAACITAADGRLIEFNCQYVAFHRFDRAEESSHPFLDCLARVEVFDASGASVRPSDWVVQKALSGEAAGETEFRLHRIDTGETWWGSYKFAPIGDENGVCAGAIITVREITDRKRNEEVLFAANQRLETLTNALPIGLYFSEDASCQHVTGNPTAFAQFEMSAGDNLSASAPDAQAPGRLVRYYRQGLPVSDFELPLQRAVAEGQMIPPMKLEVQLPSGKRWSAFASAAPLVDRSGKIVGGVATTFDITQYHKVEERLRLSEERYRALHEGMRDAFAEVAMDGHILECNLQFCELVGYSLSELQEKTYRDLTPECWHAMEADIVDQQVLQRGYSDVYEKEYQRKDGAVVPIELRTVLAHQPNGTPSMWAIIRDVTKRKMRETDLRKSEFRYRSLVQATSAITWSCPPSGLHIVPQPEWIGFTGQSAEEMLGDGWTKAVHPDDLASAATKWQRAVERGEPFINEHRIRRHDGWWRWMSVNVIPIQDELGHVDEWFGMCVDITDRKQALIALEAANDSLRHLVDHSPFGIFAVDASFRVAQVGEGAQDLFKNVQPVVGRNFEEVVHFIWPEPFATDAINRFRRTLDSGEPYRAVNTVVQRADTGHTEAYDWKIERVTLPDGKQGVVCHFYDLSERRRHEEHIELLMREVNHRAKNMLALVQSVARQTAATSSTDFINRFEKRLHSLAAAQDL